MLDILYNIFIMPIESIVELIFYTMNKAFMGEPGISILFVSLAINLLVLPLYKRADDMQEKEREKQKQMERWNKHIRKTFKGDERYMMQTAYYRIEGYKPFYAITGSLSLFFQIPFFMAAYHFLSNLDALNGASFLMISDLSMPDGIIKLGNISINLLPILMTLINIISGMIYTKGFKLKDKLQLYGMALIFLVILYKSPAGLVLYWTCNNLFSLGKNIFYKYVKNQRAGINILSLVTGTGIFAMLILTHRLTARRQYLLFGGIMLLSYLPLILSLIGKLKLSVFEKASKLMEVNDSERKNLNVIFWLGAIFNAIMLGLMVPSALIVGSPVDFGSSTLTGPLSLVVYAACVYVGLLVVWFGIFYLISNDALKKIFAYGMWIFAGIALVDYYGFFGKFGVMDYNLRFDTAPVYNDLGKLINLLVLVPVIAVFIFVMKKWPKLVRGIASVLILMMTVLSIVNIVNTNRILNEEGYYELKKDEIIEPTVSLSRDGKNVVVIMLDRAMGSYVPYIFNEKPELAKEFEGFVYYPNTVSFGGHTNYGAPALFGGYEYTPVEMNKRDSELLVDKHNESLLVMPVLFAQNGYEVDVCDPPYAGYHEIPDLSIFDPYDNITGHITRDRYFGDAYKIFDSTFQRKHVMYYSLFRTMPVLLQNSIYDDGNYLGKPLGSNELPLCAESYAFLDGLDTYTYIEDGSQNNLFVMSNLLTHSETVLQSPEYIMSREPDELPYSQEKQDTYIVDGVRLDMKEVEDVAHYHVNMASFILLGKYFDYLKEEGVYDNTRIVIVSDHGFFLAQNDSLLFENIDAEEFNPLLMVKDFADSTELAPDNARSLGETNILVSDEFMTNADVLPYVVKGLIDNPINPFTGKEINNAEKYAHPQRVVTSGNYNISINNGYTFDMYDAPLYDVSDSIFDESNWVKVEE